MKILVTVCSAAGHKKYNIILKLLKIGGFELYVVKDPSCGNHFGNK
jgi:hypothetical protein